MGRGTTTPSRRNAGAGTSAARNGSSSRAGSTGKSGKRTKAGTAGRSGVSPAHQYDESKIKTLSSLEHIRLRTGMYIGRLGDGSNLDDGIYVLLKEVVDNSVDEFIMG